MLRKNKRHTNKLLAQQILVSFVEICYTYSVGTEYYSIFLPFCQSIRAKFFVRSADIVVGATKRSRFMSVKNSTRSGCKDVFHAFMVRNATYEGELEIPNIAPITAIPSKLIPFSKAISSREFDAWVHFYEDDVSFERIWNKPLKYLPILKRYKGVIAPDFSLYRDMPLAMQHWNIYRSHAVAVWLQDEGVPVIANVRWGDERTYDICCFGVPKHSAIAIGSHGCIKLLSDRIHFVGGLDHIVKKLEPSTIIIYGTAPDKIFLPYKQKGIDILQFDSDCSVAHRKAVIA